MCGTGERNERRWNDDVVEALPGAAVEGAPLGKAATASGTTPHYARCAMSAKHDA